MNTLINALRETASEMKKGCHPFVWVGDMELMEQAAESLARQQRDLEAQNREIAALRQRLAAHAAIA